MDDLILHHYAMSPFSAKARAMLGYSGLAWQSAITSAQPPRPLLKTLTGGYRKIPVAQIGADIFCDSRSIAREIAQLSGQAQLDPANLSAEAQALATRADGEMFFACLMRSGSFALLRNGAASMSLRSLPSFVLDRIQVGRDSKVRAVKPRDAAGLVSRYLAELDALLDEEFLFGPQPNAADFSVYHPLWFMFELAEKPVPADHPALKRWLAQFRDWGDGMRREIDPQSCLEIACRNEPRAVPAAQQKDALQDREVIIEPTDYARDASSGRLVGSTEDSWIIARETPETGKIHVHFPKSGFRLLGV